MHGALVGTDPAQLAIAGHMAPEPTGVFGNPAQLQAEDAAFQRLDRGHHDFIATANGEGQAMPFKIAVGAQNDIGGRVIGIGIHRIGTIERGRGGEAQVVRFERCNLGHGKLDGRGVGHRNDALSMWVNCAERAMCDDAPAPNR